MSTRYLYGDTAPVNATCATAQAVSVGDLVALSSNTLVRAADTTWDTDLATTQTDFVALPFLGVAMQTKTANVARVFGNGVDNQVVVATAGVFEFDCASATFHQGDLVGPAKDTGNNILSQKVVGVSALTKAIGVVTEDGTSVTRVKVRLLSKAVPMSHAG